MVARYYADLLRFCVHSARDKEIARDVVQEAYARFLAAEQRDHQPVIKPGAMLKQIAKHLLIDLHRRNAVRAHVNLDELPELEQPTTPRHLQPEEALAAMQVIRAYVAAIEALPPRCREAFVLHVFDDLSHAEVAQKMGISCSMVEKHVVRGMLACKLCERQLSGKAASAPSCSR